MINKKKDNELPHISLEPVDSKRTRKISRGRSKFVSKPIDADTFRNMISNVVSMDSIEVNNVTKTYFLLDLNSEYYTPDVSEMLKLLKLEIKSVLSEYRILVSGKRDFLLEFSKRDFIPKKITNTILKIGELESNDKIGESLINLIKKDTGKGKSFPVLIRFIDNIKDDEKTSFTKIMEEQLKGEVDYKFLPQSGAVAAVSSSRKILEISKLPFVKTVVEQPKVGKQQNGSSQNSVFLSNGNYEVVDVDTRNLPIICVLDSGISKILENWTHTADRHFFDSPMDVIGHGTQVSSIAIFGEDLIFKNNELTPKAKIISFKLDENSVSGKDIYIEEAIKQAISKYSTQTKIFNLSYNYIEIDPLERIELIKRIDKFVQENNVLLINSGGNIDDSQAFHLKSQYPSYLKTFPVYSPSDAKYLFSVGSICKTTAPLNPVVSRFTRLSIHPILIEKEVDKHLFIKPEICSYGGNNLYELEGSEFKRFPDLEIPTMDTNGDLIYDYGTSFAAPYISLCFARLMGTYHEYKNVETFKAIMLNKCHIGSCDDHTLFFLLNSGNLLSCQDGIYIDFEGQAKPHERAEDIKNTKYVQCKTVKFFMPPEAESIDIFTVHSNNYIFSAARRFNTRLVVQINKPDGKTVKRKYGNISKNTPVAYGHYDFSRNFSGVWTVNVYLETRGIPANLLKDISVRFGVSIKINLKKEHRHKLDEIYKNVAAITKQIKTIIEVPEIEQKIQMEEEILVSTSA